MSIPQEFLQNMPLGRAMKECILCGDSTSKLTAEHVVQASILKKILEYENGTEEGLVSFNVNETEKYFTNVDRAKLLKPRKNICVKCNSARSTQCDEEFHNFVIKLFFLSKEQDLRYLKEPTIDQINNHIVNEINYSGFYDIRVNNIDEAVNKFSLEGLIPLVTEFRILESEKLEVSIEKVDQTLLKRFLAKHAVCNYFQQDVEIPDYLKKVFVELDMDSRISFNFYLVSSKNDLGFSTTPVYFHHNYFEYYFTFKHVVIRVKTSTEPYYR